MAKLYHETVCSMKYRRRSGKGKGKGKGGKTKDLQTNNAAASSDKSSVRSRSAQQVPGHQQLLGRDRSFISIVIAIITLACLFRYLEQQVRQQVHTVNYSIRPCIGDISG